MKNGQPRKMGGHKKSLLQVANCSQRICKCTGIKPPLPETLLAYKLFMQNILQRDGYGDKHLQNEGQMFRKVVVDYKDVYFSSKIITNFCKFLWTCMKKGKIMKSPYLVNYWTKLYLITRILQTIYIHTFKNTLVVLCLRRKRVWP